MPFGQLVIGPPGSGKTTYVAGAAQLLAAGGRRLALVNLDPANDQLPYTPAVDVSELVCLESVMEELGLGPNGGLVYCIEFLEANLDWLAERLAPLEAEGAYFIFDCPGQVELFTQHDSLRRVLAALAARGHRLAAVHLVDSHLCTEPAKYIAALLLSLGAMLHLELPHINVLSKVDLLRQYGGLDFSLDYYTEVQDLSYLVGSMGNDAFSARHRRLSSELCELVSDFGLLSFLPLAIEDKQSLQAVLHAVDKANGALYASLASPQLGLPPEFLYGTAHRAEDDDITRLMQERYVEGRAQPPPAAAAAAAADRPEAADDPEAEGARGDLRGAAPRGAGGGGGGDSGGGSGGDGGAGGGSRGGSSAGGGG
ncbi:GPN-loop GTPase [Raphidocelis subcapitata]|uniref:GPN-loop GTPase 2 n=1 Tax=Raphidocelis subcapitata TaxID=307507 RepID=A0A2V0NWH1_9CHLO|nr:GPN-loop GTPase [Raphidocelis subcapitata]|eukprot:GBF89287.1 GPN-loop GTPase [Raphidocelis subcapitata]